MDIFNKAHPTLSGHLAEEGDVLESPFSTATRVEINGLSN